MNEIEQMFYDALIDFGIDERLIKPQFVIGIYKVDFQMGEYVIEIDGYEFHKTKEQRERDYNRERYLQAKGYIPIRFTATEVYLDVKRCVDELNKIASVRYVLRKKPKGKSNGR